MNPDNTNLFEYWEAVMDTIIDDLIIQKHRHFLAEANCEVSHLELRLARNIFIFMGFKKQHITEELTNWYFEQAEKIYTIDTSQQLKVMSLASEIFFGLEELRKKPVEQT